MSIAKTILEQLGGNKFRAMTGMSVFSTGNDDGLKCVKGKKHFNIWYNKETDLYDISYEQLKKDYSMKILSAENDVPADSLRATFTEMTGLYTSL